MDTLSICAIVKNEGLYLQEWFDYHFALGVSKFYVVTNDCSDDTTEVILKNYQRVRLVANLKGQSKQFDAYNALLKFCKNKTIWAAFIDVDEFMVPLIEDSLLNTFTLLDNADGVLIPWKLFGSSGHKEWFDAPVVERFTKRQHDFNPHIKSVVRVTSVANARTAHYFDYLNMLPHIVDSFGYEIPNEPLQRDDRPARIRINHYAVKSEAECAKRRSYPRADIGTLHSPEFFGHHDRNEIEDLRALELYNRYVRKLGV